MDIKNGQGAWYSAYMLRLSSSASGSSVLALVAAVFLQTILDKYNQSNVP